MDGQHVVVACKLAELEYMIGLIDESDYESVFAQKRARFIVYDDSTLYIKTSVRINAREFERDFYTIV